MEMQCCCSKAAAHNQVQRLKPPWRRTPPQVHSVASRQRFPPPLLILCRAPRTWRRSCSSRCRGAFSCSESLAPSGAMVDVQGSSHAVGQGSRRAGCVLVLNTGIGKSHHCRRAVRAQADVRNRGQAHSNHSNAPEHASNIQGRLLREAVVDPVDDVVGPFTNCAGALRAARCTS